MKNFIITIVSVLSSICAQAQGCFISANVQNPCAQGCTHTMVIVFQGPNMPFTVSIVGPNGYTFGPAIVTSALTLTNLCPGSYGITLTDNLGQICSQTTAVITPFSPPQLISQITNATCPTCNDGAVVLTAVGGTPPYTFNFNGIGTSFANNLLPGDYFGYVTDANGCSDFDTISIGVGANGYYTVSGTMYLDVNNNGVKDSGEPGMANQSATLMPYNITMISGATGGYGSVVAPGAYDITYQPAAGWSLSSTPSTHSVTVSNASISGLDFGLYPTSTTAGGNLSLTSGLPRCFWNVPHYIYFNNTGYTPLTGSVQLSFDPLATFVSSSVAPSSQSGNSVSYTFTNLFPGQSFMATVVLTEPAAGNSVNHFLTVNAGDSFGNQFALSDTLSQLVSCSYDPNDKQAFPNGIGALNYVTMDQQMEYMIRFQNTGNDTAFKVVILDTLATALEWNTFQIVGASHPMTVEVDAAGVVRFVFDNILLPDSNVNEPGSHGYVVYHIEGLPSNPDPTTVLNTAYIYFDLNAPVQTNTTLTTFSDQFLGLAEAGANFLQIAPNPWHESTSLVCDPCEGEYLLRISDMFGREVYNDRFTTHSYELQRNGLAAGSYLVELIPSNGTTNWKLRMTVR